VQTSFGSPEERARVRVIRAHPALQDALDRVEAARRALGDALAEFESVVGHRFVDEAAAVGAEERGAATDASAHVAP
jgi:hypothetical protein